MKAPAPASLQTNLGASTSILFWNGWEKPVNERGMFMRGGQSPLGKRLRITTDAGLIHEFTYHAPVAQNMAELCARIGAAIPTIAAKAVPVTYGANTLAHQVGDFPTFSNGVWLPEHCEIKLETLSAGAGARIEVLEGSTLGDVLGLPPGSQAIGAASVELARPLFTQATLDPRDPRYIAAAVAALVEQPRWSAVSNTLASLQASLAGVITSAASAASDVASATIEAVLASYRAQINGSSSLRASVSNEVNGSLVHLASGGASTIANDLETVRLSTGAVGDLVSFEVTLSVRTIGQPCAFEAVIVEGEGTPSAAMFACVGVRQTVDAGQTSARVVLVGSRRLTIGGPVSVYIQGRTTANGGSFLTSDGRLQARLDRPVTI